VSIAHRSAAKQGPSKNEEKARTAKVLAEIKTKEESCTVAGKPKEKRKKCGC
jgi:hypothetical protein